MNRSNVTPLSPSIPPLSHTSLYKFLYIFAIILIYYRLWFSSDSPKILGNYSFSILSFHLHSHLKVLLFSRMWLWLLPLWYKNACLISIGSDATIFRLSLWFRCALIIYIPNERFLIGYLKRNWKQTGQRVSPRGLYVSDKWSWHCDGLIFNVVQFAYWTRFSHRWTK